MGVSTVSYMLYRAKLVDYLGWMNQHEFVMISLNPQEVPSYTTLFSPFGLYVWMSLIGSIAIMIILLVIYDCIAFGQDIQFQGIFNALLLNEGLLNFANMAHRFHHSSGIFGSSRCATTLATLRKGQMCQKHVPLLLSPIWIFNRLGVQRDTPLHVGEEGI